MKVTENPEETQIPDAFFAAFADPPAKAVARELAHWAESRDLRFQLGPYGTTLKTYYVKVPNAPAKDRRVSEFLLTIQQYRRKRNGLFGGDVDIPFRRMESRAFGTPQLRR